MRTPELETALVPGSFVVHPPGELHQYVNGRRRSVLLRVRYGKDISVADCVLAQQARLARAPRRPALFRWIETWLKTCRRAP